MELFEKIVTLVETAKEDVEKFYVKGNKAAGTRVRKHMQELKILAQQVRIEVQNSKKETENVEKT